MQSTFIAKFSAKINFSLLLSLAQEQNLNQREQEIETEKARLKHMEEKCREEYESNLLKVQEVQ